MTWRTRCKQTVCNPVVTALLGFVVGGITQPTLSHLGGWLKDWFFPPTAEPAFAILNSPKQDELRIQVTNEGDRQVIVQGMEVCGSGSVWMAYDPREGRKSGHVRAVDIADRPLTLDELLDIEDKLRHGMVLACLPTRAQRPTMLSDNLQVPPRDAAILTFAVPSGIDIQSPAGRTGLVGGNTWCAVTLFFDNAERISRIYYCNTRDAKPLDISPTDDAVPTPPPVVAPAASISN